MFTCCIAPAAAVPRRAAWEGELPAEALTLSAILAKLSYCEPAELKAAIDAVRTQPGGDVLFAGASSHVPCFFSSAKHDAEAYLWGPLDRVVRGAHRHCCFVLLCGCAAVLRALN